MLGMLGINFKYNVLDHLTYDDVCNVSATFLLTVRYYLNAGPRLKTYIKGALHNYHRQRQCMHPDNMSMLTRT